MKKEIEIIEDLIYKVEERIRGEFLQTLWSMAEYKKEMQELHDKIFDLKIESKTIKWKKK